MSPQNQKLLLSDSFYTSSASSLEIDITQGHPWLQREASHPVIKRLLQDELFPENFDNTWMNCKSPQPCDMF